MKLEVDEDMMDGLIVASLTESINYLDKKIKRLKKIKKMKEHEQFDLADCIVDIDALKRTRYYYSGSKYYYKD